MRNLLIALAILMTSGFLYAQNYEAGDLFKAIASNDLSKVNQILSAGGDPDSKNDLDISALWLTSAKGHLDLVKILLDHGANINALSYHGTTALWVASQKGQLAVVKELLNRGADPTIRDDSGNTALFWASTNGHMEIVKLLKNAGGTEIDPIKKRKSSNLRTEVFVKPSITIEQAKKILKEKNKDTSEAIETLFIYLNDPNSSNRRDAIWALRNGPTKSHRFVLALGDLLVDEDYGVQLAAASALVDAKESLKIILDDLMLLIKDESIPANIRQDITRGIGAIGPEAKPAVPSLIWLLKKGRPQGLISATVTALGNIGPGATEAVPMLIETLSIDDNYYNVRGSAAEALGKIGPNAKEAIPKLISLVDNEDQHLRYEAIRALGGLRESAKIAVPKLIKALNDPYEYAASSAAYSLGRIQVASEEVVNALIAAMNDGREVTSYAMALGELGPKAGKAVPSLISIMRVGNHNIGPAGIGRYHAIMALGKIGGEKAINGLKSMRTALNPNVRDAVNKALRNAKSPN
jgi:HEAT repeat protein